MGKIFIFALTMSISMGLFAKETQEQKFWSWFVKHQDALFVNNASDGEILDRLSGKLTEYGDGLTFELSSEREGKRELIISADGIRDLFPSVQKLTASAPDLKKWEVIAFRPRMDDFAKFTLTYAGVDFDPSTIWIKPIIDEGNFDLILYHSNLTAENKNIIVAGTYILLDMAIGEYDVVTGIRYIDHQLLPENPANEGLVPFSELRYLFDKHKGGEK